MKEEEVKKNSKFYFKEYACILRTARYTNDRIALLILNAKNKQELLTASTNLPEISLCENEVCIKDYHENEGIYPILIKLGVVAPAKRWVKGGWVTIPICHLLIDPKEFALYPGQF